MPKPNSPRQGTEYYPQHLGAEISRQAELVQCRQYQQPEKIGIPLDRFVADIEHHPVTVGEMFGIAESDKSVIDGIIPECYHEQGEQHQRK